VKLEPPLADPGPLSVPGLDDAARAVRPAVSPVLRPDPDPLDPSARSSPNSRLAFAAGVSEAPGTIGETEPCAGVAPCGYPPGVSTAARACG